MKRNLIITICLSFSMLLQSFAQNHNAPPARSGYSMAYDANRGVIVLFGGQDSASVKLSDTWEWSNGIWTPINIKGPSARLNAAMAYDSDKETIFLFGGSSMSGLVNDLWTYDGKSWSKLNTSSAPAPRQQATMAFDKSQSQLLLFGGMDRAQNFGDTWILKNNQWTQINVNGPTPRASHCMAYNDDLQAIFIYGGYRDSALNDFWEFKDGAWHDFTNKSEPERLHASISYDQARRRMLMFGGFNNQGRINELWEYSNKKWFIIPPDKGEKPDARAEHRSAFIPGRGLFVFGGVIGPDPNTRNLGNDTWLYNENKWIKYN
jgi:hypothetical protein